MNNLTSVFGMNTLIVDSLNTLPLIFILVIIGIIIGGIIVYIMKLLGNSASVSTSDSDDDDNEEPTYSYDYNAEELSDGTLKCMTCGKICQTEKDAILCMDSFKNDDKNWQCHICDNEYDTKKEADECCEEQRLKCIEETNEEHAKIEAYKKTQALVQQDQSKYSYEDKF